MGNSFKKGDIVANGMNPNVEGFFCGSVISEGEDIWVKMPGGSGRITASRAVFLTEVLKENPETLFLAKKKDWEGGIFVGGVQCFSGVDSNFLKVKIPTGAVFFRKEMALTFKGSLPTR